MRQRLKFGLSWLPLAIAIGGIAISYLVFLLPSRPVVAASPTPAAHRAGPSDEAPFAELRRLSRNAKHGMSATEARDLALFFARRNVGAEMMGSAPLDESVVSDVADVLTQEQLTWQATGRGISEALLLKALNKHLDLEQRRDYMRLRKQDLRQARLTIWTQVPEISSGVDKKTAKKGDRVFDRAMSPIEAFFAADMLLYKKLLFEEYSRTDQERTLSPGVDHSLVPGLHLLPDSPRRREFRDHLRQVALEKWASADVAVQVIKRILEDSHGL
jgi:hypothetical protein